MQFESEFFKTFKQDATCQNTPGSFICVCNNGFQDNGFGQCNNIDECLATPCGVNSYCHDTLGSYNCDCIPGYEIDSYKECVDIDECTRDQPCPHECINKVSVVCQNRIA